MSVEKVLLINGRSLLIIKKVLIYILSFKSIIVYNLKIKYILAYKVDFKAILIYNLSFIKQVNYKTKDFIKFK